jgi:hypothetical protein
MQRRIVLAVVGERSSETTADVLYSAIAHTSNVGTVSEQSSETTVGEHAVALNLSDCMYRTQHYYVLLLVYDHVALLVCIFSQQRVQRL